MIFGGGKARERVVTAFSFKWQYTCTLHIYITSQNRLNCLKYIKAITSGKVYVHAQFFSDSIVDISARVVESKHVVIMNIEKCVHYTKLSKKVIRCS